MRFLPRVSMLLVLGALFGVLGFATQARAAITPVRVSSAPRIDGRLEEPLWQQAPAFTDFRQSFPNDGAPPSERTELRVTYDDDNLYVGILCHDSQPELINRGLGRRDNPPASDLVAVILDPTRSRRTAYAFEVNAGGVLRDGLYTDDTEFSTDWDAVWEGATHLRPDGWSAELRIPLSLLRFSSADVQSWGFNVRREHARTYEVLHSSVIPRQSNAFVSRFDELEGLQRLRPRRALELTPYLATRGLLRPQYSNPLRPQPRLLLPSLDVGLELKASLTSDLVLNATVNPDFGQVEADEQIVNLTTFEQFYPEKRPFFTEGMDLFQSMGGEEGRKAGQMLFYSRRIGLDAPILGAAKLSGQVLPGLEVGLLDAVVMGVADPTKQAALQNGETLDEDRPDRRVQFHPQRPLHLGANGELPAEKPNSQNFLVAVTRARPAEGLTLGGAFTSLTPLDTPPCTDESDARCRPVGGQAAALDWNLRSRDGAWGTFGQLEASRVTGGPTEGWLLPDGTRLRAGDVGYGGYVSAGKVGGEPFRYYASYVFATPLLELNPTGYQMTQNEQKALARLRFVRTRGLGFFEEFYATLTALGRWTMDERRLSLGQQLVLQGEGRLPGYHQVWCSAWAEVARQDAREISGSGLALERAPTVNVDCGGETDVRRPLSLTGNVTVSRTLPRGGPIAPRTSVYAELGTVLRPHPRLQTELTGRYESQLDSPLYLGHGGGGLLFGDLDARFVSVILRQLLVLTPELTLQLYGQLLTGYGGYGPFFETDATEDGRTVRLTDLRETTVTEDPSFHTSTLNLNLVLRWEYRPGSTLFLVFSRAQEQLPPGADFERRRLLPGRLLDGPVTDMAMLKWTYRWDV